MEEEFLLLQSVTLQDFEDSQIREATIRTDENGDAKSYTVYSQVGSNSRMSQDWIKFAHPVFLSMGESHVK